MKLFGKGTIVCFVIWAAALTVELASMEGLLPSAGPYLAITLAAATAGVILGLVRQDQK